MDSVRAAKQALAPRAQEIAVAVEDAHRVRAAIEGVHAILRVDADGRDVGVELHTQRQLGPVIDDLVAILARPKDDRHLNLLAR